MFVCPDTATIWRVIREMPNGRLLVRADDYRKSELRCFATVPITWQNLSGAVYYDSEEHAVETFASVT
jgi:hypothetical protein